MAILKQLFNKPEEHKDPLLPIKVDNHNQSLYPTLQPQFRLIDRLDDHSSQSLPINKIRHPHFRLHRWHTINLLAQHITIIHTVNKMCTDKELKLITSNELLNS